MMIKQPLAISALIGIRMPIFIEMPMGSVVITEKFGTCLATGLECPKIYIHGYQTTSVIQTIKLT